MGKKKGLSLETDDKTGEVKFKPDIPSFGPVIIPTDEPKKSGKSNNLK